MLSTQAMVAGRCRPFSRLARTGEKVFDGKTDKPAGCNIWPGPLQGRCREIGMRGTGRQSLPVMIRGGTGVKLHR